MGLASAAQVAAAPPVKPKLDAQGRSYATGRRKNAISRVWIKRGSGKIIINGKAIEALGVVERRAVGAVAVHAQRAAD